MARGVPGVGPYSRGAVSFRLEAVGVVHVERELLRFGEHAMDASLLFEDLATDLLNIEYDQFTSEGAAGASGPWAPLAASTIARKGHGQILVDTGELMANLTQRDHGGERGHNIIEVTPDHLRFGTDDPVAYYHQSGTSKMPARPVVSLKDEWKVAMIKKVQLFITRGEVGAL